MRRRREVHGPGPHHRPRPHPVPPIRDRLVLRGQRRRRRGHPVHTSRRRPRRPVHRHLDLRRRDRGRPELRRRRPPAVRQSERGPGAAGAGTDRLAGVPPPVLPARRAPGGDSRRRPAGSAPDAPPRSGPSGGGRMRRSDDGRHLSTEFVINDQAAGYPRRTVETTATPEELDDLVSSGYLLLRGVLDRGTAGALAEAVLRLAEAEADRPEAESLPGDSIYIRSLLDKDPVFHPLLRFEPPLSIARTLLGPQVWIDLEARLNHAGRPGVAVPWHAHLPVIPDPVPALFSYPHQLHCLLYLDHITEREGALCLIPGSHSSGNVRIPLGEAR
ncbi:phytanoyl-CoA dioxygenase family protein [Actinomadura decatromicini]|uniref:Phytanoyl-CoA dioxygenase family protein n=2 Tax=Actinomadura decatromicini TaxID=2604572 RepID=A0A5D3FMG3_9ACTN|nr:phytanoyl-CoA dioxygenase family protein [Actinomadura decatromicini]